MPQSNKFRAPIRMAISFGVAIFISVILYFTFQSIRTEKLALTQRLQTSYKQQIDNFWMSSDKVWQKMLDDAKRDLSQFSVIAIPESNSTPKAYLLSLRQDGVPYYRLPGDMPSLALEPDLLDAQQAEFQANDPMAAAVQYAELQRRADTPEKVFYVLGQARNLLKAGQHAEATELYFSLANLRETYAVSPEQRNLLLDGWLRALELSDLRNLSEEDELSEQIKALNHYIEDYRHNMPASQRVSAKKKMSDLNIGQGGSVEAAMDQFVSHFSEWVELKEDMTLLSNHGFIVSKNSSDKLCLVIKISDLTKKVDAVLKSISSDLQYSMTGINKVPSEYEHFYTTTMAPVLPSLSIKFYSRPFETKDVFQRRAFINTIIIVLCVLLLMFIGFYIARHLKRQEDLNRLKNDILSTVSHELKTPLTSSQILLENILEDSGDVPQNILEYVKILHSENRRQNNLITNFLTFSKMESNRFDLSREIIDVNEVISECIESTKLQPKADQAQFIIDLDPPLTVNADVVLFTMMINNLIENALKYSHDQVRIEISVQKLDSQIVISVSDNGIGIAAHEIDRIFDQFFRSDQSLSRQQEGSGLGLYIVKQAVRLHSGTIQVDSTLGEGTRFTIQLPR